MITLNKGSMNWNIGDTSFRRKYIIEEYAHLIKKLYELNKVTDEWTDEIQVEYYEMIKEVLKAEDKILTEEVKAQRARTYTNALEKLGLCDKQRKVTDIGIQYIELFYNNGKIIKDELEEILNLNDINLLYLRQVLKLEIKTEKIYFYPINSLMKIIEEFKYLDRKEFQVYVFVKNKEEFDKYIINLKKYREKKINFDEFILNSSNFDVDKEILNSFFSKKELNSEIISKLFKNRKKQEEHTRKIDLLIKMLDKCSEDKTEINFQNLKKLITNSVYNTLGLKKELSITKTTKYFEKVWEHDFFNENIEVRRKSLLSFVNVKKDINNSKDYVDILRRVLNRCGIFDCSSGIRFNSNMMNMVMEVIDIPLEREKSRTDYQREVSLIEIFEVNPVEKIIQEYGLTLRELSTGEFEYKEKEFIEMIKEKFNYNTVIKLLELFEMDNESSRSQIHELVTENANLPTIYEYIVGIAWYYISEGKYNLLDSFNLIMDGSKLPETHAPGLRGDIEIKYCKTNDYEKHNLLLELTLMDKNNQRRNELEPVIRHTYNMKSEFGSQYSIFISNQIDKNVERIFSVCDIVPFETQNGRVDNVDILALNTNEILNILKQKIKYKEIYKYVGNVKNKKGNPFKIEEFRMNFKNNKQL